MGNEHKLKTGIVIIFIYSWLVKRSLGSWSNECEENGVIEDETCYMLSTVPRSYENAVTACLNAQGRIAMMKDVSTEVLIIRKYKQLLNKELHKILFWAGINDKQTEGIFRYDDLSDLGTFAPWKPNEPNSGGPLNIDEDCVTVSSEGIWNDDICSNESLYVCEFKRDPCRIKDVNIPHAEYQSCYTEDQLPSGESVTIKCHEGYILIGSSRITCLEDSQWSTQPQCVLGCSNPQQLQHATLFNTKETYMLGSQVIYICNEGYVTGKPQKYHLQLTCSPNNKWLPENSGCSLEEKYSIGTMEIETGTSINLPCIIGNDDTNNTEPTYIWLKNSQLISSVIMDYSIDVNGTLLINNMTEQAIGQYMCLKNDQKLIPASIGFDLKLKPDSCPQSINKTEQVTFIEGASGILVCPHTSSDHDFTWFKDGKQHYVHNDQTLFPDGTLYTKEWKYFDQGIYTCQIRKKETLCMRNQTTEVKIITSTLSICGNADPEYPHPWAVTLWQKDEIAPFCYGALIHESWVVSSARCLVGFNRKRNLDMFLQLGYMELNEFVSNPQTKFMNLEVQAVKIHPKFSKNLFVNDIGLVQLKNPIHFTRSVRPICLTEIDLTIKQPCDRFSSLYGTVVGWGPLEKDDYDTVAMVNESMVLLSCQNSGFSGNRYSSDSHKIICCNKKPGTRTTFAGDVGSPLEMVFKEQHYLVGIYSWGERAALQGEYDYFTKIHEYISWLKGFYDQSDIQPY